MEPSIQNVKKKGNLCPQKQNKRIIWQHEHHNLHDFSMKPAQTMYKSTTMNAAKDKIFWGRTAIDSSQGKTKTRFPLHSMGILPFTFIMTEKT